MAEQFYTQEQTAEKLGKTVEQLRQLVTDGKLQEFKDAGKTLYKAKEVDALMPDSQKPEESLAADETGEISLAPDDFGGSSEFDISKESTTIAGDHDIDIAADSRDTTAQQDQAADTAEETQVEQQPQPEQKGEEKLDEDVNLDSFGSGSGLLDLSLQADDTSLGGILDEIYTAEDEAKELGEAEADSAMAVAAEADQMISEEELSAPQAAPEMALARPMIEMAPDAQSNTLGMLLFLPLAIVIYTTVVAVSGLRGVMPSILGSIQAFIWYIMGGAAVVAGIVVFAAFMFTGERSATPKAKKEKKPKAKKEKKAKKPKEPKKPKEKKPKKPKKAKKGFLRLK